MLHTILEIPPGSSSPLTSSDVIPSCLRLSHQLPITGCPLSDFYSKLFGLRRRRIWFLECFLFWIATSSWHSRIYSRMGKTEATSPDQYTFPNSILNGDVARRIIVKLSEKSLPDPNTINKEDQLPDKGTYCVLTTPVPILATWCKLATVFFSTLDTK